MNYTKDELTKKLKKKNLPISGSKDELVKRLKEPKIPENVCDKELYLKVRKKVKSQIEVWPSAYASGLLVQEYKKQGGRYKGQQKASPLNRWYREEWVNVCKPTENGYEPCGRKKSDTKKYPYCRPSIRVTKATPVTVGELKKKYGDEKLKKLCAKKRREALPKDGKAQRIKVSFK